LEWLRATLGLQAVLKMATPERMAVWQTMAGYLGKEFPLVKATETHFGQVGQEC